MSNRSREGLQSARLLMVLASISPLFVLWAIQGNRLIPDRFFATFCLVMVVVPNLFLWFRIRTARKLQERRELVVGTAEDHRDHLLVYLFTMLLPLYAVDLNSVRTLTAAVAALAFVVFLFWHLNLHYMNILFASKGFRVFTVYPPSGGSALGGAALPAKIAETLHPREISVEGGEVSGR